MTFSYVKKIFLQRQILFAGTYSNILVCMNFAELVFRAGYDKKN